MIEEETEDRKRKREREEKKNGRRELKKVRKVSMVPFLLVKEGKGASKQNSKQTKKINCSTWTTEHQGRSFALPLVLMFEITTGVTHLSLLGVDYFDDV